jgi:hypothetical protein
MAAQAAGSMQVCPRWQPRLSVPMAQGTWPSVQRGGQVVGQFPVDILRHWSGRGHPAAEPSAVVIQSMPVGQGISPGPHGQLASQGESAVLVSRTKSTKMAGGGMAQVQAAPGVRAGHETPPGQGGQGVWAAGRQVWPCGQPWLSVPRDWAVSPGGQARVQREGQVRAGSVG